MLGLFVLVVTGGAAIWSLLRSPHYDWVTAVKLIGAETSDLGRISPLNRATQRRTKTPRRWY
jgi:hypothetical protein